jgi:hypothetical protein
MNNEKKKYSAGFILAILIFMLVTVPDVAGE